MENCIIYIQLFKIKTRLYSCSSLFVNHDKYVSKINVM